MELEEFPEGHSSGMRFELRVIHPPKVQTPQGKEHVQSPEVMRFNDEHSARAHYRALVRALGGDAPEPITPAAGLSSSDVIAAMRPLEERIKALEEQLAKKK